MIRHESCCLGKPTLLSNLFVKYKKRFNIQMNQIQGIYKTSDGLLQ